ncbi:hypothetical protein DAPK24_040960 [Pichia kluyveri]|uniref:Uncharacterized protein n=1 Tax=Pichia kluyveri TaxID=36015 RepID=A0AAV5R8E2_PICKL|nr:hypothetical protein DAPK24_040960 [Pichia kluyveri]
MSLTVPSTFEDINEFIIEQERKLVKSIKYNDEFIKELKDNGIKLSEEDVNRVLNKVNKEIKNKYRNTLFLRQNRFQVIKQIMQYERDIKENKLKNIEDVNKLIYWYLFESGIYDYDNDDNDDNDEIITSDKLKMYSELPDSNLIGTSDVELIEEYDNIRDKFLKNISKYEKVSKDSRDLFHIICKLRNMIDNKNDGNEDNNEEIKQEIERMRYLLAINDKK